MQKKYQICLMTVFLPREEIFFIEEWLRYHIAIGINHFYLYNNMGSRWLDCGNNLEVTGLTKRQQPVYKLLAHKTDEEVQEDLDRILKPFIEKGYVTQVLWQPKDKNGETTFAQHLAFMDYIKNYSSLGWTGFIDIDEFLFSTRQGQVETVIEECEKHGYTYIILPQKCFASRFGINNQPISNVLDIYKCSSKMIPYFGKKSFIKTNTLRIPFLKKHYNIHEPATSWWKTRCVYNQELMRINHYKFNKWELTWIRQHICPTFELDSVDEEMKRFKNNHKNNKSTRLR